LHSEQIEDLQPNNLELCILGILPFNASIVENHPNSKRARTKQTYDAKRVLSFQRLSSFILHLHNFTLSPGANNIHTQVKQNHNQAHPKNFTPP